MLYNGPPFDADEIKQMAERMIKRYGSKHKAEHYAMDRQNKQAPATPGKKFWAAVAQAIRKYH
jgi:hypothetical protein